MIIDLTMPLGADTPVYPGDPQVQIERTASVGAEGYLDHALRFGTHNGTHVDAPAHMIDGAITLASVDPETFMGTGKIVDVRNPRSIDTTHVEAGDIVLLYTGFSEDYESPSYYQRDPAIPQSFAHHLVDAGVKLVGIDAGSIDTDPFPIHKVLLGGGVCIVENLVGLRQLFAERFEVFALPLHVDLDGSPARVVARTLA